MAKKTKQEFDFASAKGSIPFRTPMLTSKLSPSTARMAGMAREQLEKNPNGLSYGFDAGFMAFPKALSLAMKLTGAGQLSKAAAVLARSKIAERGRSVAGPIIADARYVDNLAGDALGVRDFGAATGQARRYYQDALSQIRSGQRSRVNPVLGNFFPKVGPSLKVTMKSIRGLDPVSPVAKRAAKAPTSFIVRKK